MTRGLAPDPFAISEGQELPVVFSQLRLRLFVDGHLDGTITDPDLVDELKAKLAEHVQVPE